MSYLLGIYREPLYSPGRHTSNDVLILQSVGEALRELGFDVKLATWEEAHALWQGADLIFSMCQGPQALQTLRRWEREGALIVNSPRASLNTYRNTLCDLMQGSHIPFPSSQVVPTSRLPAATLRVALKGPGVWVKRGDVHATQPEDVQWVQSYEPLQKILKAFHQRGIPEAVLQKRVIGDEIKFYAVRGPSFFWWFYPKSYEGYPFEMDQMKKLAEEAASAIGLEIYGGDFVVSPQGELTLIDLNDWPSFAPCRTLAPAAISQYLEECFHAGKNKVRSRRALQSSF